MAFEGSGWNHGAPVDGDLANQIDDYMRDDKKAVQGRAAHEHVWPTSQTATNEGGFHKFVTFQGQTSTPGLTYGTSVQKGGLFVDDTSNDLTFVDSAGTTFVVAHSAKGVTFFGGTGAIGDIPYVTSGGTMVALAATATGSLLAAQGTTAAPAYIAQSSITVPKYIQGAVSTSIQQSATGTISAGATGTIAFGTNFANTAYSVVMSMEDLGGSVNPGQAATIRTKAVGSVTVFNGNGASIGVSVLAVGSAG